MIPQIELSYYANSLSLLSIQHPFAKGQSHARNDSTKTWTRARTPIYAEEAGVGNHVVYDCILKASADVKWRTKADTAAKCVRVTQPWSVCLE